MGTSGTWRTSSRSFFLNESPFGYSKPLCVLRNPCFSWLLLRFPVPHSFSLLKAFCLCLLLLFVGSVICCWSETLFLVFSFFVIDNVCPGAWNRFFLYFRNCLCACFPITVRYFAIKNGSVAAAVFSNPCASRGLKLESSHRRTNRRRINRIETGVFFSILISSFRFCCCLIFLRFSFI